MRALGSALFAVVVVSVLVRVCIALIRGGWRTL